MPFFNIITITTKQEEITTSKNTQRLDMKQFSSLIKKNQFALQLKQLKITEQNNGI